MAVDMDHHVPRAITIGLRLRGVDVLTAYKDRAGELDDSALLDRASAFGRVLFTRDDDLLSEAAQRQAERRPFHGVGYAHQLRVSIGDCIRDLEIIAEVAESPDLMNGIRFLPP